MSRHHVLLVEDQPRVSKAITRVLEHHGYDVVAVSHEASAAAVLARHPEVWRVDVVVTDLHLTPEQIGEGLGIVKLCQDLGIPVVLCTGSVADVDRADVVPVIDKPWMSRDLVPAIERLLEERAVA